MTVKVPTPEEIAVALLTRYSDSRSINDMKPIRIDWSDLGEMLVSTQSKDWIFSVEHVTSERLSLQDLPNSVDLVAFGDTIFFSKYLQSLTPKIQSLWRNLDKNDFMVSMRFYKGLGFLDIEVYKKIRETSAKIQIRMSKEFAENLFYGDVMSTLIQNINESYNSIVNDLNKLSQENIL